jgi:hypothetical protein
LAKVQSPSLHPFSQGYALDKGLQREHSISPIYFLHGLTGEMIRAFENPGFNKKERAKWAKPR